MYKTWVIISCFHFQPMRSFFQMWTGPEKAKVTIKGLNTPVTVCGCTSFVNLDLLYAHNFACTGGSLSMFRACSFLVLHPDKGD